MGTLYDVLEPPIWFQLAKAPLVICSTQSIPGAVAEQNIRRIVAEVVPDAYDGIGGVGAADLVQPAKAPLVIASNQVSPVELLRNTMSSVPLP
jgi:hypothetical protein